MKVPYCLSNESIPLDSYGNVNIQMALKTCLSNMNSPLIFPGYITNQVLVLKNQILLGNLLEVNDLTNIVTLDFFYRIYWQDIRFLMPAFWETLANPLLETDGIDIVQFVGQSDQNGSTNSFWRPDNFFPDAASYSVGDQFIKLYPNATFLWSRHITVDLIQSNLFYESYPSDSQTIIMRFISYAYVPALLIQEPADPCVLFFPSYDNKNAFTLNPIWHYDSVSCNINLIGNGIGATKSQGEIFINIQRDSTGIVTRLALPIFLLCLLGALTFWAADTNRVDSTTTILLAISALYIIIFQNVPMVGYLTTFDRYCLIMFATIFLCCFIHQSMAKWLDKQEEYPFRILSFRISDAMARIALPIFVVLIYFSSFKSAYGEESYIYGMLILGLFLAFIVPRESIDVYHKFLHVMQSIEAKTEDFNLSYIERVLFNYYKYKRFSSNLSRYYRERSQAEQKNEANQDVNDAIQDYHRQSQSQMRKSEMNEMKNVTASQRNTEIESSMGGLYGNYDDVTRGSKLSMTSNPMTMTATATASIGKKPQRVVDEDDEIDDYHL